MLHLSRLSLEALADPRGYDCACGRHHVCAMAYLRVGRGAIRETPQMVAALGARHPYVVCDANTYAAAGEQVCRLLTEAGIAHACHILPGAHVAPDERAVGSALMHVQPGCDMVLGVGSGVINDVCKVIAHALGVPGAIVGTAPSMDGYASSSSSMEVDRVKVSLYNRCPAGVLLDTDILAQAPMPMLWAGLGDMVAKYIALCEWRIAHIVTGEFYCEEVAALMRAAMAKVVGAADGIPTRDPDAMAAIAEGLIIAGVGMAYAGSSRPASGLEHYFSHMWEMMALDRGKPYALHGIQVGVGTVLCMKLYRRIRQVRPDRARAQAWMQAFRREDWEAQVRRIYGKAAGAIIRTEDACRKNDPDKHAARLDRLIARWDEILRVIDEELPDYDALCGLMAKTGMPMRPSDLGLSIEDTVDAFLGARDVRDKYLSCSVLWDLGLTDEFAAYLREVAEE